MALGGITKTSVARAVDSVVRRSPCSERSDACLSPDRRFKKGNVRKESAQVKRKIENLRRVGRYRDARFIPTLAHALRNGRHSGVRLAGAEGLRRFFEYEVKISNIPISTLRDVVESLEVAFDDKVSWVKDEAETVYGRVSL
jgi:hypothetical protein